jgi:integrase
VADGGVEILAGKGPDPSLYGLHSLRRALQTYVYEQISNLRAVQLLLGHASVENTKEYIGTEQAEALEIAKNTTYNSTNKNISLKKSGVYMIPTTDLLNNPYLRNQTV